MEIMNSNITLVRGVIPDSKDQIKKYQIASISDLLALKRKTPNCGLRHSDITPRIKMQPRASVPSQRYTGQQEVCRRYNEGRCRDRPLQQLPPASVPSQHYTGQQEVCRRYNEGRCRDTATPAATPCLSPQPTLHRAAGSVQEVQ